MTTMTSDALAEKRNQLLTERRRSDVVERVRTLGERSDEETLTYRPSPTAWSIKEILGHLAHMEWLRLDRMDRVLNEDLPLLGLSNTEQFVKDRKFNEAPFADLLDDWAEAREACMAKFSELSAEQWARPYRYESDPNTDPLNLYYWAQLSMNHEEIHYRQMLITKAAKEARDLWQSSQAK